MGISVLFTEGLYGGISLGFPGCIDVTWLGWLGFT